MAEPGGAAPPGDRGLAGPDPGAELGRLFDVHARPLHRYLARRVGEQVAHDLVSETFLIALRQRHTYDAARASVQAWLYGIATNLVRRHVRQEVRGLRATARAGSHAGIDDTGHESRTAERLDAQQLARRIAPALAALSEGDRDVLLLTAWAGLTSAEVAAALDLPVGTVRSRLHRVRRQLRATASTSTTELEENDDE